jgi:hypothetical protein
MIIQEKLQILFDFTSSFITFGDIDYKSPENLSYYIGFYNDTYSGFLREMNETIKEHLEKHCEDVDECLDQFNLFQKKFIDTFSPVS